MSVQPIIELLNNITQLHQSLLNISESKTEILKMGDMDQLQALLKQEQKHVQAINQLETKRIDFMNAWASERGIDSKSVTVSVLLEQYLEDAEKTGLQSVTTALEETLVELKQREQLNRELTAQSMQFVQMSLDMMSPSMKTMNYNNKSTRQVNHSQTRSLFDSKA